MVFLSGEPGIGKTRLASARRTRAAREGATVLWGAAAEDLGAPYGAWIEALSHYVEHAPPEMLDEHVARHGGEIGGWCAGSASVSRTVPRHSRPTPRPSATCS